jgi:hypothetical protein
MLQGPSCDYSYWDKYFDGQDEMLVNLRDSQFREFIKQNKG